MKGILIAPFMAVLFLVGCASHRVADKSVVSVTKQLSCVRKEIKATHPALRAVDSVLLAKADKVMADAGQKLDEISKKLAVSEQNRQKSDENANYWHEKQREAVGKLNFWRALVFGVLALNFSVFAVIAAWKLKWI